ncbi:MAG: DUF502 domain-containing protein [Alphaproteobacteria bacterium]|nr:MAG: DUF502 domain-containing protein [Alphaproteobacteria bacterium]
MRKKSSKQAGASEETPSILVEPPAKVSLFARLRTYFLTGIVVTAPIGITVYLIYVFVSFMDENITPLIPVRYNPETYLPFGIPGFGVVIAIIGLILIGFLTANFLGRTLLAFGERIVGRMPVVRSIYNALKQIMETVLAKSGTSFREVVLLEYPRKGIWSLAFVTSQAKGEVNDLNEDDMISIFVPTTPNPTSGFLLFVPKSDLTFLDMTVEDGVKLVISAGMIWPNDEEKNGNSNGHSLKNGKNGQKKLTESNPEKEPL